MRCSARALAEHTYAQRAAEVEQIFVVRRAQRWPSPAQRELAVRSRAVERSA